MLMFSVYGWTPALGRQRELPCSTPQRRLVETGQACDGRLGIIGKPPCSFDALPVQDVLAERLRERLPSRSQSEIIGSRPAVERLPEGLHALRDGKIADTHLPQIGVHIVAEVIENRLGEVRAAFRGLKSPQYHPQMQYQQIKTAVNRVWYAQITVE